MQLKEHFFLVLKRQLPNFINIVQLHNNSYLMLWVVHLNNNYTTVCEESLNDR